MRLPWVLYLALAAVPAVATPTLGPTLTGVGPAGAVDWSRQLPSAGTASPLEAQRWAPRLPDLTIPLLGGGTFKTADHRGQVVVLDVWASWCEPCRIELPHLQALVAAERARGLVAIAVNAQEPEDVAARAAQDFKITLPVGLYDGSMDEALAVRSLPALFLLDRQGRLRARWDGYRVGLEKEIAARVRALLDEDAAGAVERFGEVLAGAGSMAPRFWRDLPAPASGIAGVPGRLILHAGRGLFALEQDGSLSAGPAVSAPAGRLLAADVNGIGDPEILDWRRAGTEVLVIDLAGGTPRTLHAPGPVLDLAVLPGGKVVLATPESLVTVDRLGKTEVVPGSGGTSGVAVRGTELWAIDAGGARKLRRHAPGGEALDMPAGAFALAPAGASLVVAPVDTDLVPGSFTGKGRAEIAVRYGRSGVAVLDAKTGEVLYAARLTDPVAQLAAADLDGDGVDELAIAAGNGVLILGRARG